MPCNSVLNYFDELGSNNFFNSFLQMGVRRTKLNTLITFPIQGLDMSQHATKRSHGNQHNSGWSPWRLSKHTGTSANDYLYDLYAVCNHYGNMQGGHYTGTHWADPSLVPTFPIPGIPLSIQCTYAILL